MSKTHQVKVSVSILDFDKKTVTKPKQCKNRKICGSFSLHLLKKSSMKNFIFYLLIEFFRLDLAHIIYIYQRYSFP